ncbi:hypothetical protein [Nocardioides sp. L-11A]|uniref:hypothetical protein n=1 Tax=Nocardioides sp. L-11A TaxID=3043848 RepID=UPI00249B1495|nr:hypothetical protein QJ852_00420 [Nocardioides sp. L-11A]
MGEQLARSGLSHSGDNGQKSPGNGYVVLREGIDVNVPFAVGDPVTTYEIAGQWPYAALPPHSGRHVEDDRYREAVVQFANSKEDWRIQEQLLCDCRDRRTIAQLLVHIPTSRVWVTHKPERVPLEHRGVLELRSNGYPLHGVRDEAPHVHGVASCSGCRKRWLVVSFVDHAELIHVLRATHGARIAP